MRQLNRWAAALLAAVLMAGHAAATENEFPFPRRSPITEAVKKTKASIAMVKVPRAGEKDMIGSAVIVDERGYLVTNRHVVGAKKTVNVRLADGTELSASVLLADAGTDLAVLRIKTNKKLQALSLANIDDLMVGETVIAVGHPYGYANTVSQGIISALNRDIPMPTGDVLEGLIQHTASINPGNSGGPLLNINGELIGINVALREGAQNIAFAINASTVRKLLKQNFPAVQMAGVSHGLECQDKVIAETGDRHRVEVATAAPETGAELKRGDQIVTVGTLSVHNSFDLERALWDKKPGERVELRVLRGGQEISVTLTLLPASSAGHGQLATAPRRPSTHPDD